MRFLSASSLWLYLVRTVTAIAIGIAYLASESSSTLMQVNEDVDLTTAHSDDVVSYRASSSTITESMCILSGDLGGFNYKLGYWSESHMWSYLLLFLAEALFIPLVQLPNLRFASLFEDAILKKQELQSKKCMKEIDDELQRLRNVARISHGANLTMVGWIVFWSFLANVFHVTSAASGALPLIGGVVLFLLFRFCRCRCVAWCPPPFNSCCGITKTSAFSELRCCGQKTCAELCVCCIPPNAPVAPMLKRGVQREDQIDWVALCECAACEQVRKRAAKRGETQL